MNGQNCFEESLSLENCHYFKAARRKGKRYIYEEDKDFKIIQNYSFWWYKNKCYQNKETINILKILSTFLFILSFLTSSVFAASGFREPIWENQKYTTQSFYLPRAIVADGSFFDSHLTNNIPYQQDYKRVNGGFLESSTMNHAIYPDDSNLEMESYEENRDIVESSYMRNDDFLPSKFENHIFEGQPTSDTAKCYSCMSTFYGAVWPAINHVYKKPKNFTNKCNEDNVDSNDVPATMCSTICVHMWEDANVGGVKIKGHIRGCLDDILINGFNQTVVTWYRWMHRDSCRQYRKRELFKIPSDQSDESMVNVCTCYSDHCNSGSQVSSCSPLSLSFFLVLSLIIFKEIFERR